MGAEADFGGYATKAGLECSDGRTIMPEAFQHMDGMKVPLVWSHGHGSSDNVLGHAILEKRDDGVYAHGYFNDTQKGKDARVLVQHGDIESLSIYANRVVEKSKQVFHGMIREVSLVLSGANPGAKIDFVALAHSDGSVEDLEDEAIIFTGLKIEHSDVVVPNHAEDKVVEPEKDPAAEKELDTDDPKDEAQVEHAEGDRTLEDVYNEMTDEQKNAVNIMLTGALESAQTDNGTAAHSDDSSTGDSATTDANTGDVNEGDLTHKEGSTMTKNVFEEQAGSAGARSSTILSHDDLVGLVKAAQTGSGSFKEQLLKHAGTYGVDSIELLFPDAKAITTSPEWISRRMEWVAAVLDNTKHSPFAKVKTLAADITGDEARARGYVKGGRKVEEVFSLLARTTSPATIYKKQKLDRDDMLDITDIDVVNWLKAEMRLMIEEELARAILVGDGRTPMAEGKVKDPAGAVDGIGIRSVLLDDDLYSIKRELAANVSPRDAVKGLVRARSAYRGSGKPTLFISDAYLTDIMLEEDKFQRPLYATEQELKDKLRVKDIVAVDLFDEYPNLFAIMVSLQDYTIGSNKGGELTSFEDFDIDFNQYKYLQETRLSGGLTKPYSAIVVTRGVGTLATVVAPSFDGTTNTITIPVVTGVIYTINDAPVTGDVVITSSTEVVAEPDAGFYLASNTTRSWNYTP